MYAERKVSMLIAAIVAVVGQAAILLNDFGPGNSWQGSNNAKAITAAALSRAGATELASAPPSDGQIVPM